MDINKNGVVTTSGSPNPNIIPLTSDVEVQYTLSFWAKSTVAGDKVRSHYYNPNTTTTCVSSQGTTKTAGDGNMDFTLSTEWTKYWVVYTQTETTARKWVIFPRMNTGTGTGTVSVKKVKFEPGNVATEWIPNSEDAKYIGDTHGIIEENNTKCKIQANGYIEANSFLEI